MSILIFEEKGVIVEHNGATFTVLDERYDYPDGTCSYGYRRNYTSRKAAFAAAKRRARNKA